MRIAPPAQRASSGRPSHCAPPWAPASASAIRYCATCPSPLEDILDDQDSFWRASVRVRRREGGGQAHTHCCATCPSLLEDVVDAVAFCVRAK
jgi:hypothetical protein